MPLEDRLLTESLNPLSADIDRLDARSIVALMNGEDAKAVAAVSEVGDSIARAIELAANRFRRGGRLIYVGRGHLGPARRARRLRVPADVQLAPRHGRRPDRRRPRGADPGRRGCGGRSRTGWKGSARPEPDRERPRRRHRHVGTDALRSRRDGRGPERWRDDRRPGVQPAEPARRKGRSRHLPARRPRGHRRLHAAQGGHGDEVDPEYDHDGRNGPDRQDLGQPDDRPPADEPQAPPPDAAYPPGAGGRLRRRGRGSAREGRGPAQACARGRACGRRRPRSGGPARRARRPRPRGRQGRDRSPPR